MAHRDYSPQPERETIDLPLPAQVDHAFVIPTLVHFPAPPQLPDAPEGFFVVLVDATLPGDFETQLLAACDVFDAGRVERKAKPLGSCEWTFIPDNEDSERPGDQTTYNPGNWRNY